MERGARIQTPCPELRPMATLVFHALNDDGRLDGTISGDHAAPHRSRLDSWLLQTGREREALMNGIEASRRIKNHPGLAKVPTIIMVTAYGRDEIMRQADQMGLDSFLIKPVSASVLFDTIMQALGKEVIEISKIAQIKGQQTEALKHIRGAQILLVEDNEINQEVARELMEKAGLPVTIAANGKEAIAMVKEKDFEAVLMDVQMPVMDGFEATRRIRNLEAGMRNENGKNPDLIFEINKQASVPSPQSSTLGPQASNPKHSASSIQYPASNTQHPLPIIAMTAHAMTGYQEMCIEAGMNDYVSKPIDPEKLFSALVRWIKPGKRSIPDYLLGQNRTTNTQEDERSALLWIARYFCEIRSGQGGRQ